MIIVGGIYACYRINAAGDDKNFILRIVCIAVPVTIRIVVISMAAVFCLGGLMAVFELEEPSFVAAIISPVIYAIYYWYLYLKMKAVSALE